MMIGVVALKVLGATVTVVAPILSFLGIRYANRRWNLNLSQGEEAQLSGIAQQGVKFAEQQYKGVEPGDATNAEKFNAVRQHILRTAAQRGIALDEPTLKALIERTVYEVKAQAPALAPAPETAAPGAAAPGP